MAKGCEISSKRLSDCATKAMAPSGKEGATCLAGFRRS